MNERIRSGARAFAALALLLPLALPAAAQSADFLFRRPTATLAVRGGWAVPRASSEIFDFTQDELILDRDDFASFTVQGEVAFRVADRLDVALGVGHSEFESGSETRDFLGSDDLPIEQTTRLRRTPIEAAVKGYLLDRGRAVSRFAWVPNAWSPWLGAGAGWMVYSFEQSGEFVDYQTLDSSDGTFEIFQRTFDSDGTTPTAHVAAGLDFSLGPHLLATTEARYQWARADMSRDFVDFDPIDLSGFQATIGLAVRF